jgi:hypothetical protein
MSRYLRPMGNAEGKTTIRKALLESGNHSDDGHAQSGAAPASSRHVSL